MEIIVAITVFAVSVVGVLSMILTGVGSSRDTRNRVAAANVAAEQLELVRAQAVNNFTAVAAIPSTTTIATVKGLDFTVAQTTAFVSNTVDGGGCSAPEHTGNRADRKQLLVVESVTWPAMGQTKPVTTSTLLAPPVGAYVTTGSISIAVVGRDNVGIPGLVITVTGGATTISVTTDSAGCAFVPILPPGTYTVTASTTGYVDYQEQAPSTQSVLVLAGKTAIAPILYDRGARLNVRFVPVAMPPAAGLPVSIRNSNLLGTGILIYADTATLSSRLLFPYTSGYLVWAGRCPEANPDALNSASAPLYPGHPATTVASVTPGGTTAVDVPVFRLTVNLAGADKFKPDTFLTATEIAGASKTPCAAVFNTYNLTRPTISGNGGNSTGISVTGLPLGRYLVLVENDRKNGNDKIDTSIVDVPYAGVTAPTLRVK